MDVGVGLYQLVVMATDNGDTPLSGSAGLILRVLNCTEHTSNFVTNYFYFEIDEGSDRFRNSSSAQVMLDLTFPLDSASFAPDYTENPFELIGFNVSVSVCLPVCLSVCLLTLVYWYIHVSTVPNIEGQCCP